MAIHIDAEKYIQDLVQFYNLKQMSKTQLNKFNDLKEKGHLTKGQKNWESMLAPSASAKNFSSINVDEQTAVYDWLQEMFRSLQANERLMLEDEKVKDFVNKYYGAGKSIEPPQLENDIDDADRIGANLKDNAQKYASLLGGEEKDYKSLGKSLESGDYKSDPVAQNALRRFLSNITYYGGTLGDKLLTLLPDELKENVSGVIQLNEDVIDHIQEELSKHKKPGNTELNELGKNIKPIIETLVKDEKLRDKVISAQPDINQVFNNGLKKSNYKDGDNKLEHKIDDPKNAFERAIKKIEDKYDETLGKLTDRHKRHMYYTNAEDVVGALIGKGIKPTDGMGKLLTGLKEVQGKLDKTVQDELKWGIEELELLSGQKYFKDALRNGRDMNYMIQQIVAHAVESGNEKKAEILMETLAIMRYGPFSSSVRKQLRDSEIKIFSGTSLAKENTFMGNMMGWVDKTLKFAALGMFEVANLVKNGYKAHGNKITRKNLTEDTQEVFDQHETEMAGLFDLWNWANSGTSSSYNPFQTKKEALKKKSAADRFAAYQASNRSF